MGTSNVRHSFKVLTSNERTAEVVNTPTTSFIIRDVFMTTSSISDEDFRKNS